MLSDRRQQILAALIEEYVARAIPVGSRTLADHYNFDVSPATIRNDLSALEDEGFISQPHTSAGRVPTDLGYRAFVDRLVSSNADLQSSHDSAAIDALKTSASVLDELLEQTSKALCRFTDCLSVVAPTELQQPKRQGLTSLMRQPEFVQTESLLPLMSVIEDDLTLIHFLDNAAHKSDIPSVSIGSENDSEQLSGVSVVTCRYGTDENAGIVAVIGPTRMDYTKAIAAVRMASKTLSAQCLKDQLERQ